MKAEFRVTSRHAVCINEKRIFVSMKLLASRAVGSLRCLSSSKGVTAILLDKGQEIETGFDVKWRKLSKGDRLVEAKQYEEWEKQDWHKLTSEQRRIRKIYLGLFH